MLFDLSPISLWLPQWLRNKESACSAGDTGDVSSISLKEQNYPLIFMKADLPFYSLYDLRKFCLLKEIKISSYVPHFSTVFHIVLLCLKLLSIWSLNFHLV